MPVVSASTPLLTLGGGLDGQKGKKEAVAGRIPTKPTTSGSSVRKLRCDKDLRARPVFQAARVRVERARGRVQKRGERYPAGANRPARSASLVRLLSGRSLQADSQALEALTKGLAVNAQDLRRLRLIALHAGEHVADVLGFDFRERLLACVASR